MRDAAGEAKLEFDVEALRAQFPALARQVQGHPAVFFDGPAGSQAPQCVIDAVSRYLAHTNANHGGNFVTSRESDALLDAAHRALSDFVGASNPAEIAFGANMTTLTLALSRALAKQWRPGDEIIVSRLDHDANFTPWVLAARDAGATVRCVPINPADCTLDLDRLHELLTPRTRLVAVGCASNAVGTINPVAEICRLARAVGAEVFLDAVHYAPHALLDVSAWDCDYLACSAYKFFGPHVGILWGRRELLARLPYYKVRPAPDELPGRLMTGTQNHEGIAGTLAAVDYLAGLTGTSTSALPRRGRLAESFAFIGRYGRELCERLVAGLAALRRVRVWGIADRARFDERVPTVSITHDRLRPSELAAWLGERGIFVWHGNFYALPLTEALGLEPEGMVRIGLLHYNTAGEVERLLAALGELE